MNKVQQEKFATWEECNMRRMQHENIVTCESAIWNRATNKRSVTRKKVQHENITTYTKVQHAYGAVWKKCNVKKYKLPQWSTEKVHKNSALKSTVPLMDRYTLVVLGVFFHKCLLILNQIYYLQVKKQCESPSWFQQ